MGRLLFYLLWPAIWFYAPLRTRASVILVAGDDVLLVKNWFSSGAWQLPGGGVKIAEDPKVAAKREIQEELSLNLDQKELKDVYKESKVVNQFGLLTRQMFYAAILKNRPDLLLSKEIISYKWVNKNSPDLHQSVVAALKHSKMV